MSYKEGDYRVESMSLPISIPYRGLRSLSETRILFEGICATLIQIRDALDRVETREIETTQWYFGISGGKLPHSALVISDSDLEGRWAALPESGMLQKLEENIDMAQELALNNLYRIISA